MTVLPDILGVMLTATAIGAALLLRHSGRGWRSARNSRRSRQLLDALRRLSDQQAMRLPDSLLAAPLRGDDAWRRLIRRGRRYRTQSAAAVRR